MYSTYSNGEYDRHNEDIDPVSASAEYELEKRVDRMDVFPVEIEKGLYSPRFSLIFHVFVSSICISVPTSEVRKKKGSYN